MKPSTREWIKKAESDYQAALALARRRKIPFHDQACFHFQQSAEKYLKGISDRRRRTISTSY
jgi:HEPN domain-containing protein